ncbi:RNA polymerase sigma factor [Thermodesulfobacteriota bacterium]
MKIKSSNIQKKTDEELMQLVVDRNTEAFKALYQRYEVAIFNFILRYTGNRGLAQDLLQETFTRIWFASHSFNSKKGKFKTWLFTIALNITRSEMAKKQYSYSYLDITEMNSPEAGLAQPKQEQPDKTLENLELNRSIQQALSKLQPFLREVIILKHYQQLKFREIAQITNTPEGTLKSRFHRAIYLLKEHLIKMDKNYASSQ